MKIVVTLRSSPEYSCVCSATAATTPRAMSTQGSARRSRDGRVAAGRGRLPTSARVAGTLSDLHPPGIVGLPDQTLWPDHQHQDQYEERDRIDPRAWQVLAGPRLGQPDHEAAGQCAEHVSQAAKHGDDERLQRVGARAGG